MKTWQRIGGTAVIAAVALTACSKAGGDASSASGNAWTHPGVFTFSENQDLKSLNPVLNGNATTGDLSMFIYSYTVRYDDHANPVPDAITEIPTVANGDVSKDGLTIKYKLRHDITFQDGVPLTCKDLKFTWQVVIDPKTNVATTDGYKDIKDIDCSDPFVAVVHMKRMYAPFLQQLWSVNGNAPILPEHLLAKYMDGKGSINTAPYNSMPIGSGPFKVVEWERGTLVRMDAYPKYFRGAPKLKEVIFKIMPDENTEFTELQTHEIDMLARGTGALWPRYQALGANPANGLKAIQVDSFQFSHIDFNLRRPLLQDINIRRALAYATNKDEIIAKLDHGSAIKAISDQHPTLSWAFTSNVTTYPFSLDKARALLDADGWKPGPDGIRIKNGQRLEFNLSTQTEATNGKALQTYLQHAWHEIGVQADVKNYPTATMFQNGPQGVLEGGHFDVALYSWVAAGDPDDSAIYASKNFGPTGQNTLFWKNAKADAALAAALQTTNQAERKKQYAIVSQQLTLDVPTIFVAWARTPYVYNTDLKNFKPSSVISPFWNPWEYEI